MIRCLDPDEVDYAMREVDEGVCGNHSGSQSMVANIVRQGYYWLCVDYDSKQFVKKCDKCRQCSNI